MEKAVIIGISAIAVIVLAGVFITNFAEMALFISVILMAGIAVLMAIDSTRTTKEQLQVVKNLLKK